MPVQDNSTLKNNETEPSEVTVVPQPAKDLYFWEAPARPFKKRNQEYFSTIAAIVFLLIVILFFIKEWFLIAVVVALMFVSYVLATVEPETIKHRITARGIVTGDKTFKWEWLSRFWFTKKWEDTLLNLETVLPYPKQLNLVLKNEVQDEVKKIIEKYLLFEKPKKTFLDKATHWLQEKVPLES